MSDESLERTIAFNEQLAALSATGLPIELGFGDHRPLIESLERVNSTIALQLGRGQSIDQVIADPSEFPPRYRAALATWLRCDDSAMVLDGIVGPAQARDDFRRTLGYAMVRPLIVLVLAYLAFMFLCALIVPGLEAMYTQLWQPPSDSLALLVMGRSTMPIWGPLVPLLLLATVLIWRARSSRLSWRWLPGSSRYFDATRNASFADELATLLENDFSLDDALALAGPISGIAANPTAADPKLRGDRLLPDDPAVKSLPPMLRWALTGDLDGEPMPTVLRFAAKTYRQQAARRATVWRIMTPAVCGALLGGMVVLGYGLSLFLPVIQLLKDISMPVGL